MSGYLERIRACNEHDMSRFVPLDVGALRAVGWVRGDRLAALARAVETVRVPWTSTPERVVVPAAPFDRVSTWFSAVGDALADAGEVRPALREAYAIGHDFDGPTVGLVDRAAVAWFGVRSYGVHVNGFVRTANGLSMWVATRAASKITFPGMLDNIVAGGQPHGISPAENVVKECGEEAAIPPELARCARLVGRVSYVAEHATGLKPDTMFCFDLELPPDLVPRPVDGEVERFDLLPLAEVAELVRETERFKFNCNLVILDFLVRHRFLDTTTPDYAKIEDRLRAPLPS